FNAYNITLPLGGSLSVSGTGSGSTTYVPGTIAGSVPPSEDLSTEIPPYQANVSLQRSTAWFIDRAWTYNPPRWDASHPPPRLSCARYTTNVSRIGTVLTDTLVQDPDYHTEDLWVQVCNLTNLLLDEWARAQAGRASCLSHDSVSCDWSPQMFVDRYV